MAFSTIIRRAASRVVPLAIRASAGTAQRSLHHQTSSALFAAAATNCSRRSSPLFRRPFSAQASSDPNPISDSPLLRVLDSEIEDAVESQADAECEDPPEGFPFTIEDIPGQQTIILTRELQGETINVEVSVPEVSRQDEDEDSQAVPKSDCLPLLVTVSKEGGPSLVFGCTAYADEVVIDSLIIKDPETPEDLAYEGPDFYDLDENLQKAFHKYLEIRGINSNATNYLFGYMIEKDHKEYITWLKNIKKFVQA